MFIKFDRVLLFQMDTMIYRNVIEKYYEYDYIGAPWDPKFKICESNIGNGGLSIRNVKASINCLSKIKIEKNEKIAEDIFFSKAMLILGYKIPDIKTASLFSIEDYMHNEECFGSHKLEKFHINLFNKLLENSFR